MNNCGKCRDEHLYVFECVLLASMVFCIEFRTLNKQNVLVHVPVRKYILRYFHSLRTQLALVLHSMRTMLMMMVWAILNYCYLFVHHSIEFLHHFQYSLAISFHSHSLWHLVLSLVCRKVYRLMTANVMSCIS